MKLVRDPLYISKTKFGKQKYGRLTLLGCVGYFLEKNKKRAAFEFLCDCGKQVIKNGRDVKSGKIQSCGCLFLETIKHRGKNNALDNCKGLKNLLFYKFLAGAKRRNISVEISQEAFEEMIFKNCHYCGSAPTNIFTHNMKCQLKYNGIDRINSNKNYSISNIVPCCKHCNWAKNKCTTQEFQEWIHRLINYHRPI